MTLLVEKPLAAPVAEPNVPDVPQGVPRALSAVAIPRVVAGVAPKTSEQLAHDLRMQAHNVGFNAIAQMLRKEDDGTWH